jgi:hypothetical protein
LEVPGGTVEYLLAPLSTLGLVDGLSEIVSRCFAMEAATISSMLGDMEARVCFHAPSTILELALRNT